MAVLAMSLDILLGYTGLPSLGHAAYFGTAAYAVGILATERQAGFLTCLVAGVLLATAAAALFGLVAIRATGTRSEEHTSNSSHSQISYAVFCLKKKKRDHSRNAATAR